ncbi:MAG: transcription antitermination factor NusB [Gammaproteobacteria bacterium]|nr:transcription antitermination factor NusB [Gammaproteobacteria bacterium]|tara:strand:- start:12440 stop:12781 length:342 start_codon:yes stop_codon:yes gene_type:complete
MELGGSTAQEILKDKSLQKRYPHFKDLLLGVTESVSNLDTVLQKFMDRDLSGLDPIERSVLRLAIYEMLYSELDKPIIINESVRLTKKYGAVDGHKYVNAVLDKAFKANFQKI